MEEYKNSFLFGDHTVTKTDRPEGISSTAQKYPQNQVNSLHRSPCPQVQNKQEDENDTDLNRGMLFQSQFNPLHQSLTRPQQVNYQYLDRGPLFQEFIQPSSPSLTMPQQVNDSNRELLFQSQSNPLHQSLARPQQVKQLQGNNHNVSKADLNPTFENNEANTQISQIQKMINQIKEGCNKINSYQGNSIMVIGNTGSGKTTSAAYFSKQELIIMQDFLGDTYYSYKDERSGLGKIGHSNTESETTIPNRFGEEYWDCPGFQDSKGVDTDIVNAFFLKKIADRSSGLKFILVMEGKSLEGQGVGECRGAGIKRLLDSLVSLQSNTGLTLKNHLLIVLTKVNPQKTKDYYKIKLEKLFLTVYKNSNYDEVNKVAEDFFLSLSEVPLELFPILEQKPGTIVPATFRNTIIQKLSQISYSKSKINFPLSKECLVRMKEIIRFSLEKIQSQFISIINTLQILVVIQNDQTLKQVRDTIDKIQTNKSNLELMNKKCLEYVQLYIIGPFVQDLNSEEIIQQNTSNIQFYLNEVLCGVLSIQQSSSINSVRLSDLKSNLSTMNMIIRQEIEKREDQEAFDFKIKVKEQEQNEIEERYLRQSQEQILLSQKLEKSLEVERFQREIEREEQKIQREEDQRQNQQKINQMKDSMKIQIQKSDQFQRDLNKQVQANENLQNKIQKLQNNQNQAEVEYSQKINELKQQSIVFAKKQASQLKEMQDKNAQQQKEIQQQIFTQQQEMQIEKKQFDQMSEQQRQVDQDKYQKMLNKFEKLQRENGIKLKEYQREVEQEKQKAKKEMQRYVEQMEIKEEQLRNEERYSQVKNKESKGTGIGAFFGGLIGGIAGLFGGPAGVFAGATAGAAAGAAAGYKIGSLF